MKIIVVMITVLYSLSIIAKVDLKLDMNFEGNKTSVRQNIELDKEYSKQLADSKIEYVLSSKRPLNFPADYLWEQDSLHLKVKIFNSKGNIISSPEVTTVFGKTATIETFDSKKTLKPSLKMDFTATKI